MKIADFGLAKLLDQSVGPPLTHTYQVMGTLGYMAPEQMEGSREVDHRADLYAVGVVFYELLTGELPLGRFAPPSQKVHIDVRVDEVVLKTLEKEPDRRYQQASDIKREVERISNGPVVPAAPIPASSTSKKPDWWAQANPVGITLLALGLIDLLFFFVVNIEMGSRLQSVPSRAIPFWIIMIVLDLAAGAGVALAGVLVLWRRFWLLAVAGALVSIIPLAPVAFLIRNDAPPGIEHLPVGTQFFVGRLADFILFSSLLGIPVGMWALYVLFQPEVGKEFQRTMRPAALPENRSGPGALMAITLGLAGVVLTALGAGCLIWVTTALARHDVLREPFYGHTSQTSAVTWLVAAVIFLIPGLISLLYARRLARGPVPAEPVFVITAVGFALMAGLLAYYVAIVFENPDRLGETLGPVIVLYSEAYGWIAGFLTGTVGATLLALGPIHLGRRFWISLVVSLLLLAGAALLVMPTTIQTIRTTATSPETSPTPPATTRSAP